MSESIKLNMAKVLQRWLNINQHLIASKVLRPFSEDLKTFIKISLCQRMKKQLINLHYTIFFLNPKNYNTKMTPPVQRRVYNTILKYCSDLRDPGTALKEFIGFRNKTGDYFEALCWEYTADPKLFWNIQVSKMTL